MHPTTLVTTLLLALSSQLVIATEPHNRGPCTCSTGFVPVDVDVVIPINPTDGLNTTHTRRLQKTFDIYGELCQPLEPTEEGVVQLLLHGMSYTTQYWNVQWNGFQNYSYMEHACGQGLTTFAYDDVCAGRSSKPNSNDCQLATASNVTASLAQDLKSGRVSYILTGSHKTFKKVVGIAHSLGSQVYNYALIGGGASSPIDAAILTGHLHDPGSLNPALRTLTLSPASEVDPVRWGSLDSGYVTTPNRTERLGFYKPNLDSFSHHVFELDWLTQDVGSLGIADQLSAVYVPAYGFKGPVALVVGGSDETHCLNNGGPCNQTALQATEPAYFPQSRDVTVKVFPGYGHDINLEFSASEAFQFYVDFVRQVVA